jgi:3,4-dihydroxy-2-butanone 4-phosphate synthase
MAHLTAMKMKPQAKPNGLGLHDELSPDMRLAIESLRKGRAVILYDGTREAEGDIAFAGVHASEELIHMCLKQARGLLCVVLTPEDASRIGVQRLKCEETKAPTPPFGMPIDVVGLDHATSTSARAATIRAIADRSNDRTQFVRPGHISTLIGHPLGMRGRFGHTECVLDLLTIAGIPSPGVLCEMLGEDGEIATLPELLSLAKLMDMPLLDIAEVARVYARASLTD